MLDQIERESARGAELARQLAYDLRPPSLDDRGLAGALSDLTVRLAPVRVDVRVELAAEPLPAAVEVAAYRIVAEGLANVARHAGASEASVLVRREPDGLALRVTDNGTGLPPDASAGVGVTSMRERAAELGGTLVIETGPAGGTTLAGFLPIGNARP